MVLGIREKKSLRGKCLQLKKFLRKKIDRYPSMIHDVLGDFFFFLLLRKLQEFFPFVEYPNFGE